MQIMRVIAVLALALFGASGTPQARNIGITVIPAVQAPLVPVGSRAAFPMTATNNAVNNFTSFQNRSAHTINASGTFNNLVLRFSNVYYTGSTLAVAQSALTLKVGVKMSSGSYYRCYWTGNAISIVLQPGDVADCSVSIPPVSQGERFLINRFGVYASAPSQMPGSAVIAFAGDEVSEWGNSLVDKTLGQAAFNGAVTNASMLPPICIMSRSNITPGPSVLMDSDGITSFGEDDTGETLSVFVKGYAQRALQASSIPFAMLGVQGETKSSISQTTSITLKYTAISGCGYTHLLDGAGTTDIGPGNVTSTSLYQSDNAIRTAMAALGIKHIPITLPPRTDSTNTAKAPGDATTVWAQRIDYNQNKIRANNGTGDGYFDFAATNQDVSNNNLWRTDLGAYTEDGIHPTPALHTQGKADLIAAIGAGLFN